MSSGGASSGVMGDSQGPFEEAMTSPFRGADHASWPPEQAQQHAAAQAVRVLLSILC